MKHYKTTCDKELLYKGSILNECNDCWAFELTNKFKTIIYNKKQKWKKLYIV